MAHEVVFSVRVCRSTRVRGIVVQRVPGGVDGETPNVHSVCVTGVLPGRACQFVVDARD